MSASSVAADRRSIRRGPSLLTKYGILCVSLLITFILSAQAFVSFPLLFIVNGVKRSWPIIDYPMYNKPHFLGDEIPRMAVVGIRENAQEMQIRPEDIGGGYWQYQVFARAVTRPDKDVIQDIVRSYEVRHNVRLAALRVENRPLLWNGTQVAAGPVEILRTYPLVGEQRNSDLP